MGQGPAIAAAAAIVSGLAALHWLAPHLRRLPGVPESCVASFGRLALSREQVVASNWVGLCVLSAVAFLVAHFALGSDNPGALLPH